MSRYNRLSIVPARASSFRSRWSISWSTCPPAWNLPCAPSGERTRNSILGERRKREREKERLVSFSPRNEADPETESEKDGNEANIPVHRGCDIKGRRWPHRKRVAIQRPREKEEEKEEKEREIARGAKGRASSTEPGNKREKQRSSSSLFAHLILETREQQIRPFSGLLRPHLRPRFTDRPLPRTANRQARYEPRPYVIIYERRLTDHYTSAGADPRIAPDLDGRGIRDGGTWDREDGRVHPKMPDRSIDAPIARYILKHARGCSGATRDRLNMCL